MPFRGDSNGVGIDIVDDCQLRCVQCFYKKGSSSKKMVGLMQFKKIMAIISKYRRQRLELHQEKCFEELYVLGGEPTLHPEIVKILNHAVEYPFTRVILVTNGLKLADREFCRAISHPRLAISMHRRAIKDSARDLVNKLGGSAKAYDDNRKAWDNIHALREEGVWQGEINVQLNLLKPLIEYGHALDVFIWARKQGYYPVMEMVKSSNQYSRGSKYDPTPEQIQAFFEKMRSYDNRYFIGECQDSLIPPVYAKPCTLVETGLHILVDGTVIPCVGHHNIRLGNILQDDFEDMVESDVRKAIIDYHNWIVGPCRVCEYFETCHAGCRGEAIEQTGCARASDPYCWHIPKGLVLKDMVPENCKGCVLEGKGQCEKKV